MALRQTEGLIGFIIALLGIDLAVPDHTTLSRRAESLDVVCPRPGSGPVHLLVDSTGQIEAATLTTNDVDDASQVGALLDQVGAPVTSFTADGAYDQDGVYGEVVARHSEASVIAHRAAAPCRATLHSRRRRCETLTCRSSPSAAAWLGRRPLATTGRLWSRQTSAASSGS